MSIDQLSGDPRSPRFTILRVEGDDAWCRLDNPYLDAFRIGDDDVASIRPYLCMASIAPTNRARCGKCSETIGKGTPRVGMPYQWRGSYFGYVTGWYHAECVRFEGMTTEEVKARTYWKGEAEHENAKAKTAPQKGKKKTTDYIEDERVRDELMKMLTSESKPKCEEDAVDPNAGTFLKREAIRPAEPPRGLVRHLLPFQREGLAWMMGNEKTAVKGGILADEMGMGKTIQAVSLVLKSKEERLDRMRDAGVMDAGSNEMRVEVDVNLEEEENLLRTKNSKRSKKDIPKSDGELQSSATKVSASNNSSNKTPATLVVVPTSALVQW